MEDRDTEESQRGNYKKGACFFGIGETIYANSEQRGEWDQSSMKTFKKKEKKVDIIGVSGIFLSARRLKWDDLHINEE